MKSMKIINVLVIAWITFFNAMGNNNPVNLISNTESKTFILDAKNYTDRTLNIEIIDHEELILLSHTIDTRKQEAIKINMENLPDGIYTVVVEDAMKTVEKRVIIKNDALIVDAEFTGINHKPIFNQNEDFFDLSWLQLNDNKVEIKISDSEDIPVFEEILSHNGSIQRRYDISRLEKGEYTFWIQSNGTSFTKAITVK